MMEAVSKLTYASFETAPFFGDIITDEISFRKYTMIRQNKIASSGEDILDRGCHDDSYDERIFTRRCLI